MVVGMLATVGLEGTAFFRSPLQPPEHQYPYLQLGLFLADFGSFPSYRNLTKINFNMNDKVTSLPEHMTI